MKASRLLFWLLLLGCADPRASSVQHIFRNMTRNLTQLIEYLPEDFYPGPDFYEIPWKPLIIIVYLGIAPFAILICSYVLAVKHRLYQANVQQVMLTIKSCMEENSKILEKISSREKKVSELTEWIKERRTNNDSLSNRINILEVNLKTLEEKNETLTDILGQTQSSLQEERLKNANYQDLISENEKLIASLKDSISKTAADIAEVKNALLEAGITLVKAKTEEDKARKENADLKTQEEKALTDCTAQLNCVSDCMSEDMSGELAGDINPRTKIEMHQMIDVSRENTSVSAAEDALKPFKFQLSDLMPAVCKLQEYKKKLEDDCSLLRAANAAKEEECKSLKLKIEIFDEILEKQRMAAEEMLKLKAREQEERQAQLSEVEGKANMATKEIQSYKQNIKAMEEKLQAAECSFREQIACHEKKAHENWIKVLTLERELVEQTRETDYLKYKLEFAQNRKPQEEGGIKAWVLRRPDMHHPPPRDPGPGAAPLWNNGSRSSFPPGETEEGKVSAASLSVVSSYFRKL
ncbi:transport and Golgi organization protein 1 homolog [Dasypus novemcinctus]|uniref:transport and Golgi organization protein 1 homolog n=1 Tax=Dasypus novemcinctus TaxID=9361 RepID=UPI00265DF171|nr:transport and Golgi organization protein 1 homolog [Dasypus novemcinctus]